MMDDGYRVGAVGYDCQHYVCWLLVLVACAGCFGGTNSWLQFWWQRFLMASILGGKNWAAALLGGGSSLRRLLIIFFYFTLN